jgi:hypothetical protein
LDGIWVTIPLLLGAGLYVDKRLQNLKWDARDTLFFSILLVVLTSFTMSFSQFIYQGRSGYSQATMIINFATILFLLILGYLAFLFWGWGKHYVKIVAAAFLVLLMGLQISFSFRAAGLTTDKTAELLWPGSLADGEVILSVLTNRTETKEFVDDKITIGIEEDLSPQLFWILRDAHVTAIPNDLSGPAAYDLIISGNDTLQVGGPYIGQSFTAKKYPKWIEKPLGSLFDYDYWVWLFFRNSTMSSLNNTIWYAMD